jgi:hypothetical protein
MAVTWKAAIQAEHGVLVQWHVRSFTPGREVLPNLGKLYISRASGITSTEWGADLAKLTRETATSEARRSRAPSSATEVASRDILDVMAHPLQVMPPARLRLLRRGPLVEV